MATVFFNEFHYDNAGADSGEFIEIAGPAGTNLAGWKIVLYNGSGGAAYATINLSAIIPNQQNGFGTVSVGAVGLQNGAPDGFALVDPSNTVVQFLSYEGTFTATSGPANGMVSTDIGVAEADSTGTGLSLQLKGTGADSSTFTWNAPSASSQGAVNGGQTFGPVLVDVPGSFSIADAGVIEGDVGTTAITFTVSRGTDSSVAAEVSYTVTLPGGPGGASAADFAAPVLAGSLSFAADEFSKIITLNVSGDTADEGDETFTVNLSAPTNGAGLDDAAATGTIQDDDAPPPPLANVFFNEVHYDNTGTDAGERIEVAGRAGTSLAGWSIVLYNGNGGTTYGTLALGGTIADQHNGFGTLSFAAAGLQNGAPDGFALIDQLGRVMQFLSYEGSFTATNGPAAGLASSDIGVDEDPTPAAGFSLQLTGTGSSYEDFTWTAAGIDTFGAVNAGQSFLPPTGTSFVRVADVAVVEGDAGTTDMVFVVRRAGGTDNAISLDYAIVLGGSAAADDLAPGATLTGTLAFAAGVSALTVTVPVAGDTAGELNEALSLVLSNPAGDVAIVEGEAAGTILNDDPIALTIMQIQGEGHESAYLGQPVVTSGVVTALRDNGFFVQDAAGDGNARTSDGVFVFTSGVPGVAVGDSVRVSGEVAEFASDSDGLSLTEIVAPAVTVLSSGNPLPASVQIGAGGLLPPSATIEDDGFASFDPLTDGIDFWESLEGMRVTLDTPQAVSNANGFGEVDVVASLGAGATGMNDRGGITIADGDFNPEKIQLDDLTASLPGFVPALSIGDELADVNGIVNYAFNNFEVLVTEDLAVTSDVTLAEETTALAGDLTHVSLATYNLENLDPADHDPLAQEDKFDLLAEDIVYRLGAPDIIAVQEIQDADGPGNGSDLSGMATAQLLIEAIEDALGPTYVYVEVAPTGSTGGEPGGHIRNGYFYNPERVDYIEGSARLIFDSAFNGSRNPLVADFQFNGEQFSAINVHFTSRGGSDPLWGATQPPANGGESARLAQAAAVQAYVNDALATNPSLEFAVLGDFNGFYFEDFQELLTDPDLGGVFTNLNTLLPEAERYSYLFEGNAQQLDHVLVTGGLLHNAAYDAVHLNSQMLGTSNRPTDHDPQLALLYFNLAPAAADDGVVVNEDATTPNLWDTLLANDTDPGSAETPTIASVDTAGTLGSVEFDPATQTLRYVADDDAFDALSPGETATDTFEYTIVDADGATSTATVTVTVTGVVDGITVSAGNGADTVNGTGDEDHLSGGRGDDMLFGYGADDVLAGEQGADRLFGGAGRDVLIGGQGDDRLAGGGDEDLFVFGKSGGQDTVLDFDVALDRIAFEDGQGPRSARTADLDGDGQLDTVLAFTSGGAAILLGVDDPTLIQFADPGAAYQWELWT